jgi:indole-3-glycerol phosphate synthase / phosphoribosylanthranilate isomerase
VSPDARLLSASNILIMTFPQLKICGVNDVRFARRAEELGADYLGLIFAAESPRAVTVDEARQILKALAGWTRPVGVFMHETANVIAAVAGELGLGIVQVHRRLDQKDFAALKGKGLEVWALAGSAAGDAFLFDSTHGDGEKELRLDVGCAILAGGISEANLDAAIRSGAAVIDVSSSLESARGVKSIKKLNLFMQKWASKKDENCAGNLR